MIAAADGGGAPKAGQSQPQLWRTVEGSTSGPHASKSSIAEGTARAAALQGPPIPGVNSHHLLIHFTEIHSTPTKDPYNVPGTILNMEDLKNKNKKNRQVIRKSNPLYEPKQHSPPHLKEREKRGVLAGYG